MNTAKAQFGTFAGVFTPNVLTILGVILFLRMGWVVGNAGVKDALWMLALAHLITVLTGLSLSAIATNKKVEGGGAYYLISRSLGLEIGGSIGIPLFLAQAISVAFYVIGFTESLTLLAPEIPPRLLATGVLLALFGIGWLGADWAIKTQYVIMTALGLALASFFLGFSPIPNPADLWQPGYEKGHDFWSVFAIFFPAVTGIMSGVSMSGNLKDPARSIPRGTLWAIGITLFIYTAQIGWLALNAPRADLTANPLIVKDLARIPALIYVGIWAATLSSALACLLAAPRTLQALGHDRILPGFIAREWGRTREPRLALLVTLALAQVCILFGNLNLIAPLITMFFLATYGMINLAAGIEGWVANPTYRPTFRFHWLPSLAGAYACGAVMFILNPLAFLLALLVLGGVYFGLTRRHFETAWGDVRSGFWFAVTRFALLKFGLSRQHVHNWRPVLLVLTGPPQARLNLVQFANRFEAGRGLLFLAHIHTGQGESSPHRQALLLKNMEDFIRDQRLSAVPKIVQADTFELGVATLLQVSGLGALQPNTVLIGWSDDELKKPMFARSLRRICELRKNLIVYAEAKVPPERLEPVIDIWWRGRENGSLMLTLAHLLQQNPRWRDHAIRVRRIIRHSAGLPDVRADLQQLLDSAHIKAEIDIRIDDRPAEIIIAEHSRLSAVCFIGLAWDPAVEPKTDPLHAYERPQALLQGHLFIAKNWQTLEL